MGLSKLSAKCQACPFVDTCDNKKMESLGLLPLPVKPTEQMVQQSRLDILQNSMAVDQVIQAAQQPFEESIRAYLSMIERGIMTIQEVSEMRNLK